MHDKLKIRAAMLLAVLLISVLSHSKTEEIASKDEIPIEIHGHSSLKVVDSSVKQIKLVLDDIGMHFDLIRISSGSFLMGCNRGHSKFYLAFVAPVTESIYDEWPERTIKITRDYYIGKYKVTAVQFCKFLNSMEMPETYIGHNRFSTIQLQNGAYIPKPGCENSPVNVVHWTGATAFCKWLGEKTGLTVRLPTEAEWEYTACGTENRPYPWGRDEDVKWREDLVEGQPERLAPVDAFQGNTTPDGVVGMAGIVAEWCSDLYGARYSEDDCIDPQGPTQTDLPIQISPLIGLIEGRYHVLRGRWRWTKGREYGEKADDGAGVYGFRIVVETP